VTRTRPPGAGPLLRDWRARRRHSQLDLALAAGVSARHLSFVETGRARPSRELLLALAESLEVPLRERNAMLLAAGYAPSYPASALSDAQLRPVREALEHLLAGHLPYPALVLDRWGDVQLTNTAVAPLLAGVAAELLEPPVNVYRLSLHPAGLAPRIRNLADWAGHLVDRLARQAHLTGDPRLAELLAEVRDYPAAREHPAASTHPGGPAHPAAGPADAAPLPGDVLLGLRLAHPAGELHLLSAITNFGAPHDVTLAELGVESFFPADAATRDALHRLAAESPEGTPDQPS
jgi:transcriptional regulator with XRE-family HTH domain